MEKQTKDMALVTTGSKVSLNFALRLDNGDVVDSTFETQPASLTIGDGNLPAGFEKHILGLEVGHRETFAIAPVDGFGQYNESNIQRVERGRFAADMELAEGLVMSFADPAGGELPGVISAFDENFVTVDFNHPLAGKTLSFEVEILSVE
ncbi:FKBP-type peptidyl-prolyl cis-trans isomerase [Parendozoicomonas haliclonae]|uniref:Peptidyl-prolyl cis-trans isomerase n=1 Tax=Parendozoicomonas haliclonae TaxID=1960125 RepID=A0A1X7AQJ5_9GAMM|nr:peptidylprolyl isomerase [Parendozoicomonas haliclonae]SMA50368.1 FKBP-type 16 kDa peptidyl-prolyl cis-trans isomerase [Parendozoicomonas haliclonae]